MNSDTTDATRMPTGYTGSVFKYRNPAIWAPCCPGRWPKNCSGHQPESKRADAYRINTEIPTFRSFGPNEGRSRLSPPVFRSFRDPGWMSSDHQRISARIDGIQPETALLVRQRLTRRPDIPAGKKVDFGEIDRLSGAGFSQSSRHADRRSGRGRREKSQQQQAKQSHAVRLIGLGQG